MALQIKLMFILHSLGGGGAERVTVALAKFLSDRGYDVCVVTMTATEKDFHVLDHRVTRVSLNLAAKTRGLGKMLANLRRLWALFSIVRRERPAAVVGMMTTAAVFSIIAGRMQGVPVVVSERIFPGDWPLPRAWRFLRRATYPFASAHVAQTHLAKSWLASYTGARNVCVIPNAVIDPLPDNEPSLAPDAVVPFGRPIILAVGRGTAQKGFDLLIAAFAQCAQSFPDWCLVIVGPEGEFRGELADYARSNRVSQKVYLPGRLGNLSTWYARADVFVLSSRAEGFPNVLLEAMACGCCCVAFDCKAGPSDVIRHRLNGLLVPVGEVDSLAQNLAEVMQDESLRNRLACEARKVRMDFSEHRVFGKWAGLMADLTS